MTVKEYIVPDTDRSFKRIPLPEGLEIRSYYDGENRTYKLSTQGAGSVCLAFFDPKDQVLLITKDGQKDRHNRHITAFVRALGMRWKHCKVIQL